MDNPKLPELTEEQQLDLFCIAWHLTNFWEDAKLNRSASTTIACNTCRYQKECWEKYKCSLYKHFDILTKLTGVKISAAVGDREDLIRRTLNNRFIENIRERQDILNK